MRLYFLRKDDRFAVAPTLLFPFSVRSPPFDTDLIPVTQGFHSTAAAAAPGCNIYFLNYLAGELLDEARGTPPYDDPAYGWMKHDWDKNKMTLPVVG